MSIIKVKNLTRQYKDFFAVNDISFEVGKAEIFAFLGPNGAGKSTTIKMLTTVLKPTSGAVSVAGFNALTQKDEVRRSIGVIFQDHSLDDDLTAYENMQYHALMYSMDKSEYASKINDLLDYVGLLSRCNDLVKTFSGGMKRRLEIARGLLHSPQVLFLDEPTLGLDVQTKNFLWQHVRKLNKEQKLTVFLTTHNMEEAAKIADRIAIIDRGKILAIGTLSELKKQTKTQTLEDAFLALTGYDLREEKPENKSRIMHKMRRK